MLQMYQWANLIAQHHCKVLFDLLYLREDIRYIHPHNSMISELYKQYPEGKQPLLGIM